MPRGPADLTRAELARLVPELLLCGHMIDRAGMPHLLGAFGLEGMRDIAIEEWKGASPHYTMRMQRALGYTGQGVVTIFKGLQLDVGPRRSSWTSGSPSRTGGPERRGQDRARADA